MAEITIQVPASTSNCGAGFDALAIALQLYGFVRLEERGDGTIAPLSSEEQSPQTLRMAEAAAKAFAAESGTDIPAFTYDIWGEVPIARGLNHLAGDPLGSDTLIRLAASLDNAPDNSTAAFLGGFCAARTDPESGAYLDAVRFDVGEDLVFVILAPDTPVLTSIAREALPGELPFQDAVRSLNSAVFLTAVFATGAYDKLEDAVSDYIHQPYRERINPGAKEAIAAGIAAGAYTGWLSGSGSSIVCPAPRGQALDTGKAMRAVFEANGIRSRLFQLRADNDGLRVAD